MTFTYRDINILNIAPASKETILETYPFPKNKEGQPYTFFAHYKYDPEYISEQFKEMMLRGGMVVKHSEVFFRPGVGEDFDAFIHVDGHRVVPCIAKINYVIGESDNIMRWYMPRVRVEDRHQLVTNAGTKYLAFPPEDVMEIDHLDMSGLYVVNAGIPHSVQMKNGTPDRPRICLSIVPMLKNSKSELGGDDVYLRLLWGAQEMNLIPRSFFDLEKIRITGIAEIPADVKAS